MDRFPPHVIVKVVQHCVAGPDPEPKVLTLCSDLYLSAVPILYQSPRITSKIDSFFLHAEADHNLLSLNLSDRELVAAGHTKLAALRHVHNLHIVSAVLGAAVNIMPYLETVQIGCIDAAGTETNTLSRSLSTFSTEMLRRASPSVWCQTPAPQSSAPFRNSPGPDSLPISLHLHTNLLKSITVLAGSTTHLYIHGSLHKNSPTAKATAQWLGAAMSDAFRISSAAGISTAEDRSRLLAQSAVHIYGSLPSILGGMGGPQMANMMKEMEAKMMEMEIRGSFMSGVDFTPTEIYTDLRVEIHGAEEMTPCPGCGVERLV